MIQKHETQAQIVLNILQTTANVSEEPRGRKLLLNNYLNVIDKFSDYDNILIKEQWKITRDIITWKP